MRALKDYLDVNFINEVKAMNLLQDYGIISDECVTPEDVGDSGKAVAWLHENLHLL